jgi:DNA-binding NarL/FixJ family response regulator
MFDDARQAAAMRDAGAEAHLSKSASFESLLAAIRRAADRVRRPEEGRIVRPLS